MNRKQFKVIVGGVDIAPFGTTNEFVSAFVTNSRLMGVLVVYIRWRLDPDRRRNVAASGFHQFFYIETSEFGIESYRSIAGDDAATMLEAEQAMLGGLGAKKTDISKREAFLLIQQYAKLNEVYGEKLPDGIDEYDFILQEKIDATPEEEYALLRKTCEKLETTNQLINYFLMRLFAGDLPVAGLLSAPDLAAQLPREYFAATLCMNKIEKRTDEDGADSHICESLIETDEEHRIIVSELRLTGETVSAFDIISDFPISNVETAMKLERPEFITVYETPTDPEEIRDFLDKKYPAAMKRDADAGRLYLIFNENNHHLKEAVYRLNDDVKGMLCVTDEGQLILAAYSLPCIRKLERDARMLPFGDRLFPVAKYEFREDIFYDFIRSDSGDFVRFVDYLCDFDPERDDY
ncbi:MAG: hypothetical protein LBH63_05555 [Clostridiales Family XIII bacterium]|nr:hypothetical protein [Clostridiales Family XIII bacterium]